MLYNSGLDTIGQIARVYDQMQFILRTIGNAAQIGTTVQAGTAQEMLSDTITPAQKLHQGLNNMQMKIARVLAMTGSIIEGGAETLQVARLMADAVKPGFSSQQWKELHKTTEASLKWATEGTPIQKELISALSVVDELAQKDDVPGCLASLDTMMEQIQGWAGESLSLRVRAAPATRNLLLMRRLITGKHFLGLGT